MNEIMKIRLQTLNKLVATLLICSAALLLFTESVGAQLPVTFEKYPIPFRKGDLWGYADSTGKLIIEPQYEEAMVFFQPYTFVKKNGKYGMIDVSGNLLQPFKYEAVTNYEYRPIAKLLRKGKSRCLDADLNKVDCNMPYDTTALPPKFFRVMRRGDKCAVLITEHLYFNEAGFRDVNPAYLVWDLLEENYFQLAWGKKNDKWYLMKFNGDIIRRVGNCDDIQLASTNAHQTGFLRVEYKDRFGFINDQGASITETKYLKTEPFKGGVAKVWLSEDFWFYVDQKGKEYYTW